MKKVICFILAFYALALQAQQHDKQWVTGYGGLSVPVSQWDRTLYSFENDGLVLEDKGSDGMSIRFFNASICGFEGDLKFYTNGLSLYNGNFEEVPDSDDFNENEFHTSQPWFIVGLPLYQGGVFLPDSQSDSIYYLFHMKLFNSMIADSSVSYNDGVYYTKLNSLSNNESGEILVKGDQVFEDTITAGGLHAVKHGNGIDWWLLKPSFSNNIIHTK